MVLTAPGTLMGWGWGEGCTHVVSGVSRLKHAPSCEERDRPAPTLRARPAVRVKVSEESGHLGLQQRSEGQAHGLLPGLEQQAASHIYVRSREQPRASLKRHGVR